ncbi:MAG: hypothetical protein MZV65_01140 [Chromatiales bacterium]|nr:hypothetical protein [Chromatiales bacterium]
MPTTTRSSATSIDPLNAAPKNPWATGERQRQPPGRPMRLLDLRDRRASRADAVMQTIEESVHPAGRLLLPERVQLFDAHQTSPRPPGRTRGPAYCSIPCATRHGGGDRRRARRPATAPRLAGGVPFGSP